MRGVDAHYSVGPAAGGSARLLTEGALTNGVRPDGLRAHAAVSAASGMAGMAMLRVAAAESSAWELSSVDVDALQLPAASSVEGAPQPSVQGITLQVINCFFDLKSGLKPSMLVHGSMHT